MDWGIQNRLARLIQSDGHCFFLPIDHGYFQGPTTRLERPGETIKPLIPYADGLFVTRGVLRSCVDPQNSPPIILRVSPRRLRRSYDSTWQRSACRSLWGASTSMSLC